MAVKVLIERWVQKGFQGMVWQLLREQRAEAVRTRGYLFGETWRSVDNPQLFMVLSVWASPEHWPRWADDEYHKKMDERVNLMLRRPSRVRMFEDAVDPDLEKPPMEAVKEAQGRKRRRPPSEG